MNQIDTPEGKLLYLVYDMYQREELKSKDRYILKDMIISGNPIILERYRQYTNQGTELTLKNSLRKLCWQQKQKDNAEISSASSTSTRHKSLKIAIPKRDIQKIEAFKL